MEYMYVSEYINDDNHLLSLKIVKDFWVKSGLQVIIVLLTMSSIITSRSEMRSATFPLTFVTSTRVRVYSSITTVGSSSFGMKP